MVEEENRLKGLSTKAQQITLLTLLGLATLAGLSGGILMAIDVTRLIGVYTAIGGMVLFVAVLGWVRDVELLPILHRPERTVGPTRSALDWQILRISSLLLNFIVIIAFILLLLDLLAIGGVQSIEQGTVLQGLADISNSVIAVVLGFTIFQSLRTEYTVSRSTYRVVFSILLLAGAFILALGTIGFSGGLDAPFMLLASAAFASLSAYAWRDLPTVYSIATEEKTIYRSSGRITRTQSTIVPTVVAFGLLFVVLLMFMLFGATSAGRLGEVVLQPSFILLATLMIFAIIGSVVAVMLIGRKKEELQLFEEEEDLTLATRRTILYVSLGAAIIVAALGAVLGLGIDLFGIRPGRWVDFVTIAIMIGIGPYGFYVSREHSRIRRLEERFPDLLRDIASSHRGGLTLPASVAIAARGEYGPLTPEIQRMADQMSWNTPFTESLSLFSERVATPLIQRAVALIQEAGRSGGSTSEVLLAAAKDARQLKNMENDRRLTMTLYGVIIYITFFVFLLVATVLHQQFVPQIIASSASLESSGNFGGYAISVVSIDEYRAFYFLASVVQGIGGGIVAGMMADGKALLGLKHAFVMTFIAYVTFALFLV